MLQLEACKCKLQKLNAIAWSQMGDPNANIPTPKPVYMRPIFGSFSSAISAASPTFVSQARLDAGIPKIGFKIPAVAVSNTRNLSKADLKLNEATLNMEVNLETYEVRADGYFLTCKPASVLPMAQRYFLF